ncbi:MAG: hypothetical protein J6N72_09510, partial [Psychrobacter sp.]|nr:hypothetical protein [Psychrobacter sp.]
DDYFKKVRSGGCLVSVTDSISLANQITSLSGGTISSVIMSQVQNKIEEASQKMLEKLFNKGCEIMLEASQNVYGSMGDLAGKYAIYSDPNYVGDTLLGMVDTGVDNALFDFDKKVDEIGRDILERDKNRPSNGTGGNTGPLVPPSTGGNMGGSTGNTSIDEAQKSAAAQTVIDLAQSRNNLEYPLFHRLTKVNGRVIDYTHLHSLNPDRPQGAEMSSRESNSSNLNDYGDNVGACTYIASVSTINNEIRRLAASAGVQDTSGMPVQPNNIPVGYWNAVNNHIRSAVNGGAECSQAAITPQTSVNSSRSAASTASIYSAAPSTTNNAINYGAVNSSSTNRLAPAANNSNAVARTSPSTNEATQYMQTKQDEQPAAVVPPAPTQPEPSSNPFNKMKNFFN